MSKITTLIEVTDAGNGVIGMGEKEVGNETVQMPIYLSRHHFAFDGEDMNNIYPSRGTGCMLNKVALKALVINGLSNDFPDSCVIFADDWMLSCTFQEIGILR